MGAKPPRIWGERVYDGEDRELNIRLDTPTWFTWLATPTTVSFSYPVHDHVRGYLAGFMTVRKERRQRGESYWVAYRRCHGRLCKAYLGATEALTKQCLDTLAQTFLAASQGPGLPAGKDGDS